MSRRLPLPGSWLVLALTTALWAAQEPSPLSQAFPTASVEPPPPPQPYAPAPVPSIPSAPPLPQTAENDPAVRIVVPAALPPEAPGLDADLRRALGQLRLESEALAREREDLERQAPKMDSADPAELALLRQRLLALRKRLEQPLPSLPPVTGTSSPNVSLPPPDVNPKGPDVSPITPAAGQPSDPYLLAQAQFRAGQYQEALAVYRSLQPKSLTLDERLLSNT